MAFGIESSTSAVNPSASSLTFAHTVTAANLLVFKIGSGFSDAGGRAVVSVTYNGVAAIPKGASDDANFLRQETWILANPATGTHDVVVTMGDTVQLAAGVTGLIDADIASFGTYASNFNTGTNTPSVTVPSAVGEIVIAGVSSDANATITEGGTLQWEREAVASDTCYGAQSYSGAASVNATWTGSTPDNGWAADGISIKPSGGAAADAPPVQHQAKRPNHQVVMAM